MSLLGKEQEQNSVDVNQYTLFSYFRSSTSWRVRIVLNHKKLKYDYKFIHLVKNQQSSEDYLKINPNGAVPALVLPTGQVLIESMAICEFLEEKHPDYPFLPQDPLLKAQIRGFCEVINSGIHPYQNLRLLKIVGQKFKADKMEFAKDWVLKGMQTIQKLLAKSKGKYCFGDNITLADVFFYPQVMGGIARFGVNIKNYPLSQEVLNNLKEIDSFVQSQPKNQPDFQN